MNRFGAPLIPYLDSKFTKTALLGHPCFLFMETPQPPTQNKIFPQSTSAGVRCTKIASFPSHYVPYRGHSGPIIDPTPTPTTTPSPAIKNKQTKSSSPLNNWSHDKTHISSPFADGRWDMDKSTPILLNQNTVTLYAFHQTDHPIYITPKQKTTLVEILVRIATPMDHRGEPEWRVPLLFKKNGTASSLALRHQSHHSPTSLIDPFSHWRYIAFQPTPYLPHQSATIPH